MKEVSAMKFHTRLAIVIVITIIILPFVQVSPIQAQDSFDRHAMLDNIVNGVILPSYQAFVDSALDLETVTQTFSENPNLDTLADVQDAWRDASDAWEEVGFYGIGLELMSLHNQIDKRPANINLINRLLDNADVIDENFISIIGSTQKGLPAIEYFIFDAEGDNQAVLDNLADNPQYLEFVVALTQYLPTSGENILRYWSVDGDNFAEEFINADQAGGEAQGSINILVNEMFATFEMLLQMRIGEPSGITTGGTADPTLVDAPRSRHSLARIDHTLIGLQRLFTGGEDNALGFDDYLDFLGADYEGQTLSSYINAQFEASFLALDLIDAPLQDAVLNQTEAIQNLYDKIRMTFLAIRVDMASQLSVLVTFSDADGDG